MFLKNKKLHTVQIKIEQEKKFSIKKKVDLCIDTENKFIFN